MATTVTCDICMNPIRLEIHVIKVRMPDGEHPHNGSKMSKDCDLCLICASRISRKETFKCSVEVDDAVKFMAGNL